MRSSAATSRTCRSSASASLKLELYPWMEANAADVLTAIRETKDLSKETEALLNKAITTRVAEFLQNQ